jgi:hypothetical protein
MQGQNYENSQVNITVFWMVAIHRVKLPKHGGYCNLFALLNIILVPTSLLWVPSVVLGSDILDPTQARASSAKISPAYSCSQSSPEFCRVHAAFVLMSKCNWFHQSMHYAAWDSGVVWGLTPYPALAQFPFHCIEACKDFSMHMWKKCGPFKRYINVQWKDDPF